MVEMHERIIPELRFPEFAENWQKKNIGSLLERASDPVQPLPDNRYREIGVRSHGRGLFHKDAVKGLTLGDKRVFNVVPNALVLNIVFAWEQAVAITTEREREFIASHRFPMFLEREGQAYLPFVLELLLTKRGKQLLALASPGGAGRNKTLGQQEFLELKVQVPSRTEQKKIASFLGTVERKLEALRRKRDLLSDYKRGVMQQIFSQSLRFKSDDGSYFPNWQEERLGDLGYFQGGGTPDTSVDEYWTGSILWVSSSDLIENSVTKIAEKKFISEAALCNSATKLIPAGSVLIVSRVGVGKLAVASREICTSQDFCNFTPTSVDALFLAYWLLGNKSSLLALCQGTSIKGLTTVELQGMSVPIPHPDEQRKIAAFLSELDRKIDAITEQVKLTEAFKKGLLQQMFV